MAGVGGVFEPGDGLLFGAEQIRDLLLGQPPRPAQGGELQSDVPGLICGLKTGAKIGILKFALQVAVEIGLLFFL